WGHQDKFEDLNTGLYVLGIHGGHPRLVANLGYRADVGGATWSPDSKTIVFSAHNNGPGKPSRASALFAVGANGRGLRRLTPWHTEQQNQRARLLPRRPDHPVPAQASRTRLRRRLLDNAMRRQLTAAARALRTQPHHGKRDMV